MNKYLVQLIMIFLIFVSQQVRSYNVRDSFVLLLIFYMNITSNRNFDKAIYDSVVLSLMYIALVMVLKRYIYTTEGFKSGKKKKKRKSISKKSKDQDNKTGNDSLNDDFDDLDLDDMLDKKKTVMDIYKGMTKGEMSSLSKDTKELMKTQNNLLSTLKTMGPVLEQGKDIIGSFNQFFGNDSDLNALIKN